MSDNDACIGCVALIFLISIVGALWPAGSVILFFIIGFYILYLCFKPPENKDEHTYNNTENQNNNRNNNRNKNQNNKHNPADDFNNINNENIRPNEVNRKNKNIKKIDINTAGIDDIKKLPGITIISAKKLIQYRENGNYVKSMYDLGEKLNLKDYQLEQLRPYVLISKNKEYRTTNYTRRVDL